MAGGGKKLCSACSAESGTPVFHSLDKFNSNRRSGSGYEYSCRYQMNKKYAESRARIRQERDNETIDPLSREWLRRPICSKQPQ